MDYDPPWMHSSQMIRRVEQKLHMDSYWARIIARKVRDGGYEAVISMSERVAVPLAPLLDKQVKHLAILINTRSTKWLAMMRLIGAPRHWHAIITYSRAEAAALRGDLGLGAGEPVYTIHNYVDTDFFSPVPGAPPTEDFIMSQGLAWRDYPTLIRAMQGLPDVSCHISAKSAWDDFSAGYEGMSIPDNVQITSYDHPSIIRNVFARCRFVVIPLQPHASMWCSGSTSILQAQAMGKPVIVSYLPGIAEYVKDGETGFVVEPGSPSALREAIRTLWENPEKARAMGEQAQAWVRERFPLSAWADKVTKVLENGRTP